MLLKKIFLLFILTNVVNFCFSQEAKIKVYAFVAEECPVSISMAPALKSISEKYAGTQTEFYLVFPMATSTAEAAEAFKTENNLTQFTVKVDRYQTLTKKLSASVTPEVIITGTDGAVLYKGRINDSFSQPGKKKHTYANHDFADAMDNISAGREMPKPWKPAVGCYITIENQ